MEKSYLYFLEEDSEKSLLPIKRTYGKSHVIDRYLTSKPPRIVPKALLSRAEGLYHLFDLQG